MIKVLMVASEAVPFAKTGGLADVLGSLPDALKEQGVDVRVIMPQYGSIPKKLKDSITHRRYIFVRVGWRNQYCGINEAEYRGVKYYFIDNEYYFSREGLYGHYDDGERFVFFCRAVLEAIPHLDFVPDILHCHDWQTGMVPVLLEANYREYEPYRNIRTLFTIHNLQYQGVFPYSVLKELLGLSDEYFTSDKLEFYGNVNFMKGGLVYSNHLSTVSPTYAEEIQNDFFGEKLEGLLQARKNDLTGILNGIDLSEYNPEIDPMIFEQYSLENLQSKKNNKTQLQKHLNLPAREDVPMIGLISRLVSQKGLDLIECIFEEILKMDIQFVVLGTGDKKYQELFDNAARRYPEKVSSNITFNNVLAHRIYAGSDMFLMPSLFEPCGLGQIISLRYGTIPIVRETGGLKDTIKAFNEYDGSGNGFSFSNYNAHEMLYTIRRAAAFYNDKTVWESLVKRAMSCDFSWRSSAARYIDIYNRLRG